MDYIRTEADGQLAFTQSTEYLFLPSCLYDFTIPKRPWKLQNPSGLFTATKGFWIFLKKNGFVPADRGCT